MENDILVSIETVKIKDYIFSSNRLKIIRGASYLLDYLNQIVTPKVLKSFNIDLEKDVIYINAGNAKFFVKDQLAAEEIIDEIKKKYNEMAPGSRIVASYQEKRGDEKVWDLLDRAAQGTAIEKNRGNSKVNIDLPFVEKCSICNENASEYKNQDLKENSLYSSFLNKEDGICLECLKKLEYSDKVKEDEDNIGFYSTFRSKFNALMDDKLKFANQISKYKDKNSYIGFIYSDGDSLGNFLKNIKERYKNMKNTDKAEQEYLEFYKKFSSKLDEITKDSLIEVIIDMEEKFPINNDGNKYYGEFLIVGGDDLCGVFSPELALEISQNYQIAFQDKMKEFWIENNPGGENKSEKDNITTSSGVVIAKHNTPIHYLFEQSLNLQKSAKLSRHNYYKPLDSNGAFKNGFLDFQVIGSEGTVDISKFRSELQDSDSNSLLKRPYIVKKSKKDKGENTFEGLKSDIIQFKKENFPKNKLRDFYDIKKKYGDNEFFVKLDIVNLVDNIRGKRKKELAIEKFFDGEMISDKAVKLDDIFDIIEIYDFIKTKSEVTDEKN